MQKTHVCFLIITDEIKKEQNLQQDKMKEIEEKIQALDTAKQHLEREVIDM